MSLAYLVRVVTDLRTRVDALPSLRWATVTATAPTPSIGRGGGGAPRAPPRAPPRSRARQRDQGVDQGPPTHPRQPPGHGKITHRRSGTPPALAAPAPLRCHAEGGPLEH